jgi:cytidylate kinase
MVITFSRQFMAGATEVGQRVADMLEWTLIDDAFVERVAERSGYTPDEVERLEERAPTFMERFAQSSALSFPEFLLSTPQLVDELDEVKLAHVTREVVAELGRQQGVVLVGRAAAAVLASERDAIHVRLIAPIEYRVTEAMRRLDLDENEARERLEETDRNRERYHQELYGRDWNDPTSYDMILNTERIGTEGAAELVATRARALGWGPRP